MVLFMDFYVFRFLGEGTSIHRHKGTHASLWRLRNNCLSLSTLSLTSIYLLRRGRKERSLQLKMPTSQSLFFIAPFSSHWNTFLLETRRSIPQSVTYIMCSVCYSWMLFLGIFHLQAFCCLLISLKMERISRAGSLHGAELFPAEQLPSGHGNQKYAPTVWDSAIHAATTLHRAGTEVPLEYHCRC